MLYAKFEFVSCLCKASKICPWRTTTAPRFVSLDFLFLSSLFLIAFFQRKKLAFDAAKFLAFFTRNISSFPDSRSFFSASILLCLSVCAFFLSSCAFFLSSCAFFLSSCAFKSDARFCSSNSAILLSNCFCSASLQAELPHEDCNINHIISKEIPE